MKQVTEEVSAAALNKRPGHTTQFHSIIHPTNTAKSVVFLRKEKKEESWRRGKKTEEGEGKKSR